MCPPKYTKLVIQSPPPTEICIRFSLLESKRSNTNKTTFLTQPFAKPIIFIFMRDNLFD